MFGNKRILARWICGVSKRTSDGDILRIETDTAGVMSRVGYTAAQAQSRPIHNETFECLIIAEAGIIEAQAVLLCESIRRFGGRYAEMAIAVISPRPDRRPSADTLRRLESLRAAYIPMNIISPCPDYGPSFKVLASAEYERMSKADTLMVLDSDSVFLGEPDLALKGNDVAARPVDVKGMCTTGESDPYNIYWKRLCDVCDADYHMIPYLTTTVDRQRVKASYNGGFVIARRDQEVFQRTESFFQKSVKAGLRPHAGNNLRVMTGHGLVSYEGSEFWGSSQACLSLALWSAGLSLRILPPTHNFPLHYYDQLHPEIEGGLLSNIIHVHYHHLFRAASTNPILDGCPGFPAEGAFWLQERLGKRDDEVGFRR